MDLRSTLRQFDIKPKKSLGQNFLFDEAILNRIVQAGEVGPTDTVLEIGPGAGSLTRALAQAAARVVAVELDNRLLPVLQHTTGDLPNVTLIHGDILQLPTSNLQLPTSNFQFKVIANIPYYITAPILRHL
ncbi:MAG TPA: rRNA adenine N-6-methyltransferase family protein, partial [Anaerolineales bacterium]|nr:rRNA adenine N-6-methyltransferase family protein [Anaerolineales bacterium]